MSPILFPRHGCLVAMWLFGFVTCLLEEVGVLRREGERERERLGREEAGEEWLDVGRIDVELSDREAREGEDHEAREKAEHLGPSDETT